MSDRYRAERINGIWCLTEAGTPISEHRTEREASLRAEECNRYANRRRP